MTRVWQWQDDLVETSPRLCCLEPRYRLEKGEHPSFVDSASSLCALEVRKPFKDIKQPGLSPEIQTIPPGVVLGHVMMTDNSCQALIETQKDEGTPLCPLFVKDLGGRVIYIGLGPLFKKNDMWRLNRQVTFPSSCTDLPANTEGRALIENVFFTTFRGLDMTVKYGEGPLGDPEMAAALSYFAPNLYPYKLRLDTFYIDGWKVPQTQAVFARSQGIDTADTERAVAELMRSWADKPTLQSYENFIEEKGDDYFEALFNRGCTLIPTFEGHNGFNKVSKDFSLEDFWPGRAVAGLHKVVERRPDSAPEGTILEVVKPGFVTAHRIDEAEVIVSDGTAYRSPHMDDPEARVPDLRLPHQRTLQKWGSTWLPTHPSHFEEPPLWWWADKTGAFVQTRGPLWDPLHYFYESAPLVINAQETQRLKNNPYLVRVPDHMKLRFYPAAPMRGFDAIDIDQFDARRKVPFSLKTSIYHFDSGQNSCDVGYHPLPLMYELELDNWWFPELFPPSTLKDQIPFQVESRICPVISSKVIPELYISAVNADEEFNWMKEPVYQLLSNGIPTEDYPQLKRYIGQANMDEVMDMVFPYLAHVGDDMLSLSGQAISGEFDRYDDIEKSLPGLFNALVAFRDQAQRYRRLRYRIFRDHFMAYIEAYWMCVQPEAVEKVMQNPQQNKINNDRLPSAAFTAPPTV